MGMHINTHSNHFENFEKRLPKLCFFKLRLGSTGHQNDKVIDND